MSFPGHGMVPLLLPAYAFSFKHIYLYYDHLEFRAGGEALSILYLHPLFP